MGEKADIADRRRRGRRAPLTPGEFPQFPLALCQFRQASPKRCGCWPALTPGEFPQFPQVLCQSLQPSPKRCGSRSALTPGELAQFPLALCQSRQPPPKRCGWRPALTPGESAQFPQALCQSRQPSPKRCGSRPALTSGELAQFPQALCQFRQASPKRWWPKHWSPVRGCQYYEVGGWPRCRSSVDECRHAYATTLLRNVKCFFDGGLFVHRKGRTFFGLIVLGADALIACSPQASCWRAVVRKRRSSTI